jgi:hypothetical protein
MKIKTKFARVPQRTKSRAMGEYLKGKLTAKQIGEKYGFDHRRLRVWFQDEGRLDEFVQMSRRNQRISTTRPMPVESRHKIVGFKCTAWNGGKKLDKIGKEVYGVYIFRPDHPAATKQGYVYEHRLVMENDLGRYLREDEIIHHVDLDPTNNKLNNLMVLDACEHGMLHVYLQHALVKLMAHDDLRKLSFHLLGMIRENGHSKRIRKGRKKRSADG